MYGVHPGRRTRAAGGVTHLRGLRAALALVAVELVAAPAALGQVPDPTAVIGATLPPLPAAPHDCVAATTAPAAMRAAMLCAINVERASHGLPALGADPRVESAATSHVRDMVRRHYFAHQRRGGPRLMRRLQRAGWRGRGAGEALYYGCGELGSPLAALRAWLKSPPHRAILLERGWSAAGVGVSRVAPMRRCRGGATWVLDAVR